MSTPNLTVFGPELIDFNTIQQIGRCIGPDDIGVLTADAHYGYQMPIGGAVAYKNHVSLSGVGWDIGCGNLAVRTNIKASDLDIPKVMDEIAKRISFGLGRVNNEKVDHPIIDKIHKADFTPQRAMRQLAHNQLGTVGGGNHFVDLMEDQTGMLWIAVHFGSRGFGHKTTMGFIALSQGKQFGEKAYEGPMDAPPILFDTNSQLGQDYIAAMQLAGEYATAGREVVVAKVLEILGNPQVTRTVHNHHNFAWEEVHYGNKYWVVRKGCTPAWPGQEGFIGANMMESAVIVRGMDSEKAKIALYSTVHGAGRVLSRTQAAGKTKWLAGPDGVKRPTIVRQGSVNFDLVQEEMTKRRVELRGGGADEAPECYKKLSDVLDAMGDTIEVTDTLRPIGVAMAAKELIDPYKD